jgi:hypothetical protein
MKNILLDVFEQNRIQLYSLIDRHGKYDFELCKQVKEFLFLEGVEIDNVTPVYSTSSSSMTGIECVAIYNGRKHSLFLTKDSYTFGVQKV